MKKYEWRPSFGFPSQGRGEGWSYWEGTGEFEDYIGYVCREHNGKYWSVLSGGKDEILFSSMREAAINLIERTKEKEKADQVIPVSTHSYPGVNAPKAPSKQAV